MSSQKAKKPTRPSSKNAAHNAYTKFITDIEKKKNSRFGLSFARQNMSAKYIPTVVRRLFREGKYLESLCVNTFPKDISALNDSNRLSEVPAEKEFLWAASILSNYATELSLFAELRDAYDLQFMMGAWCECESLLSRIQSELGTSIWLIGKKIQLLQSSKGLQNQKDFLVEILNTDGISRMIVGLALYSSLRAEENCSLEMLRSTLADFRASPEINDYFIYQINDFDLVDIGKESHVINIEEIQSITDRYLAFLAMAELHFSRNVVDENSFVSNSLKEMRGIKDPRLVRLVAFYDGEIPTIATEHLEYFDRYTAGHYDEVDAYSAGLVELKARSRLCRGEWLDDDFFELLQFEGLTPEEQIVLFMSEMLLVSKNFKAAERHLSKLALMCFRTPMAVAIASFIYSMKDGLFAEDVSALAKLHAIQANGNPWTCSVLNTCLKDVDILENELVYNKNSCSLKIQKAITLSHDAGIRLLNSIDMPDYRMEIFRGHLLFRNGLGTAAIEHYESCAQSNNDFAVSRASLYIFKVQLGDEQFEECLERVVAHCLINPGVVGVYPLQTIAESILRKNGFRAGIVEAIFLSLAARFVGAVWERELSDVYERLLDGIDVDRPSKIDPKSVNYSATQIVYFLRYVCVQRIMDDSLAFKSVTDVEQERIKICAMLIELDKPNSQSYATEIRSIVREEKVSELHDRVHSSKIYVSDEGILSVVSTELYDLFLRYGKLIESPYLSSQAEVVDKLVRDRWQVSGTEYLEDFRVPAAEKEGLFEAMLIEFTSQFAYNPAFGLDTNVSTSIRHGAFEGHIRRAFAIRSLLCERNGENEFVVPMYWTNINLGLSHSENAHFKRCLERFTERVEKNVVYFLDQLLRIQGDDYPDGLFRFECPHQERLRLMNSYSESVLLEEVLQSFLEHCWSCVDSSLGNVRNEITHHLAVDIDLAAKTLISSLEKKIPHEKVIPIIDAINSAKTEFVTIVETVANWFQRSKDFGDEAFEFGWAVDVALQQVRNCYVDCNMKVSKRIDVQSEFKGTYFVGAVDVMFILLQNVARHSGYSNGEPVKVKIGIIQVDNEMIIEVENLLGRNVDLEEQKRISDIAETNYNEHTVMNLTNKEGGSGLSKVYSIFKYVLKCDSELSLLLAIDEREFSARLRFDCSNIVMP